MKMEKFGDLILVRRFATAVINILMTFLQRATQPQMVLFSLYGA